MTPPANKPSTFITTARASPFCHRFQVYAHLIQQLQQKHEQERKQKEQQQKEQQQKEQRQREKQLHQTPPQLPARYKAIPQSLHVQGEKQQPHEWTFCMTICRQSDSLLLLLQVALYTLGFVRLRLSEHAEQRPSPDGENKRHERRSFAAELLLNPSQLQQQLPSAEASAFAAADPPEVPPSLAQEIQREAAPVSMDSSSMLPPTSSPTMRNHTGTCFLLDEEDVSLCAPVPFCLPHSAFLPPSPPRVFVSVWASRLSAVSGEQDAAVWSAPVSWWLPLPILRLPCFLALSSSAFLVPLLPTVVVVLPSRFSITPPPAVLAHPVCGLFNVDAYKWDFDSPSSLYAAMPLLFALHTEGGSPKGPLSCSAVALLNPTETFFRVNYDEKTQGEKEQEKPKQRQQQHASALQDDVRCWFCSEGGAFDLLLLCGVSPLDCHRQLHAALGLPLMPPLSALGKHQSRWSYENEEEANEVIEGLDAVGVPFDALWLDIDHTPQCKYFLVDPKKFCIQRLADKLHEQQRLLVLVADPHLRVEAGYLAFEEAVQQQRVVLNGTASGRISCAKRSWQGIENLGLWIDMNEPSVFGCKELTLPRAATHRTDKPARITTEAAGQEEATTEADFAVEHWEVHNLYGLLHQDAAFDGLFDRTAGAMRPFILSRSGFLGSWGRAFLWTGDNEASWHSLRAVVPMLLSAAACGQSFVGADVGGFVGSCDAELLLRWQQLGVWMPFYRMHSDKASVRREAFRDSLLLPFIRKAILDRYRLLPLCEAVACTLYRGKASTASRQWCAKGYVLIFVQPVVHSILRVSRTLLQQEHLSIEGNAAEKTKQKKLQEHKHELPNPPETEDQPQTVALDLPRGYWWYDLDTGAVCCARHEDASSASDDASVAAAAESVASTSEDSSSCCRFPLTLRRIPVFIRGGCVIATRETPRKSALLSLHEPLTLHVYLSPHGSSEGRIYIDDAVSHIAIWGVCAPPLTACLVEGACHKLTPLQFSVSSLPLNPEADELRKPAKAFQRTVESELQQLRQQQQQQLGPCPLYRVLLLLTPGVLLTTHTDWAVQLRW
ncbi:putative alpha-glucosidase II [Cyclospora cayetanensis]|uniref:Alpha-glucosidase II n=1 Tax=Cyclospora cayetanensis TaxID=88456 RepID=A0A1D3CYH5_9EIME|nr:putative alpha-glucosidase II [Cyclospora cayetanensis]